MPYEIATARTLLGQACRHGDDAAGAAAAFDAARLVFDGLGVRIEARDSDAPRGPAPLPAGLTAREAEVLRLVAAGHTNKEVTGVLFLSDKTVARHASNIYQDRRLHPGRGDGVRVRAASGVVVASEHER